MLQHNTDGSKRRNRSAFKRPDYFRALHELLEDRTLLSVVTWTIDPMQSSTTLTIPDQNVPLVVNNMPIPGGVTFHIGNQTQTGDTSHAWTVGNTAAMTGTMATDYVDGTSIQFLTGQSSMSGVVNPMVNFYPNPGTASPNPGYGDPGSGTEFYPSLYSNYIYDGGNRTDGRGTPSANHTLPTNGFQNLSTVPAVFGLRAHAVALFGLLSADAAYVNLTSTSYDDSSGVLPINGSGQFAANSIVENTTGSGRLYGLNVPTAGQIPDYLGSLASLGLQITGTNAAPTGTVTSPDPINQPLLRRLTVPLSINLSLLVDGATVTGTMTGQIVATATINTQSLVVGRDLFYANSSRYDLPGGSNPQTPLAFSDDNAIATDKSAYLPGSGAATFSNVSSYDKGINGIMVDLLGGGSHTSITQASILNDFTFKVGNSNSPSTWAAAPLPTAVTVRPGAGASGSDRIELIWADNVIQEQWIEVTVKATADTGLAANDVFFFGNEIGATGASNTAMIAKVSASDVTDTQTHGATLKANIPVTNIYDFNKDGQVGSADVTDSQTHGTTNKTGLNFINIGAGGPFAPVSSSNDSGIASALASTSASPTPIAIPTWIVNRLDHVDLNHGPVAKYLEHLAHDGTAKAKQVVVNADQVADALNLDDTLLDSLVAGLNS